MLYPKSVVDGDGQEWCVSDAGYITKSVPVKQEYPKWVHGHIVPDEATEKKILAGTHQPVANPLSAQGADPHVLGLMPVPPVAHVAHEVPVDRTPVMENHPTPVHHDVVNKGGRHRG